MSAVSDGFARVVDRFVTVAGERLHYREAGEGPPLILLHTGGASAREYDEVMPLLAARHRIIAWDMPGHGDSDRIVAHRRIEDYATALAGFLDALGLARAILVGVSIGGYIAMAFARRWPERVTRLIAAEAPLRSPEWYVANWAAFEAMCAIPSTPFAALAPRFRVLTPAIHARWNIDREKAGSWTIVDIAWAVRDFDAAGTLAALDVPLTVLIGGQGPTVAEAPRWAEIRPEATITVLPESGHFLMIDDPDGFAAAVSPAA